MLSATLVTSTITTQEECITTKYTLSLMAPECRSSIKSSDTNSIDDGFEWSVHGVLDGEVGHVVGDLRMVLETILLIFFSLNMYRKFFLLLSRYRTFID